MKPGPIPGQLKFVPLQREADDARHWRAYFQSRVQLANQAIAADAANIAHCRQIAQSRRHQMPQDASEAPARYLDMVPSAQGHCA